MTGKILKKEDIKGKAKAPPKARPAAGIVPGSGGIVQRRVVDADKEASRILVDAEREAVRIKDEAEDVLMDAKAKAAQEVKRGYAEGEAKGLAQVTEKLVALTKIREEFYDSAEPEVIKLVLEIAEKVIGRLVAENPEMIRSVVRQALEKSLGDRITVRLNPDDYKAVMAEDKEIRDVIDRTKRLTFREDDSIAKGGCILETEVGTIDAQLETQLAAIRKALIS